MQRTYFSIATLLLGSIPAAAEQQYDAPGLSRHSRGYTFSKKVASIPDDALPLLLGIEVLQKDVVAGENFPIRFTITNPNSMALRLSLGGQSRPSLYAGLNGDPLTLFVEQSLELQVGRGAILLAPTESATLTRTVCLSWDAVSAMLYAERGYTLRLRGAGVVRTVAIDEPGRPDVLCKWESEEIRIPVRAPTAHERKAYRAIRDRNEAHQVREPSLSQEEWRLARVDFHQKFLNEYGDTPYANQIRVLLLRELSDLPRQKSGHDEEPLPPFFPRYVKTVLELLDAGVPYASEVNRGVLETLAMGRRWDMVATALEKLLGMPPSERTLDHTLASVAREFVDFPRLVMKGYISEGNEAEDLRTVALRCIERCGGWSAYRAVPFDRRTFAFLSEMKRWDLLELTARRTLEAARLGQNGGEQTRLGRPAVDDETIAAAKAALNMSGRERDKEP